MMGSRGSGNSEAIALGTLLEIREWVKNADTKIPAALVELRKLSGENAAAQEAIEKAEVRNAERAAEIEKGSREIAASKAMLANQQRDAEARESAIASHDAELSERERALDEALSKLADDVRAFDKRVAMTESEMLLAHNALDRRKQDTEANIKHRLGESAAEIAEARRAWEEELTALRAAAASDVDNRLAEVVSREAAVSLREAATRKHAAELAALAQE